MGFLFGVGGEFPLTPLPIFSAIPTSVAMASVTGQVVAASTSDVLSHYRREGVNRHLATHLVPISIVGAVLGVTVFDFLNRSVQPDLFIALGFLAGC